MPAAAPAKRGRGRPPKKGKTDKKDEVVAEEKVEETQTNDLKATKTIEKPTPKKRGRPAKKTGRGRKPAAKKAASSDEDDNVHSDADEKVEEAVVEEDKDENEE